MLATLAARVLALEKWSHQSLRKGRFTTAKALFLVALTVLVVMLPLAVTGQLSFGDAEGVCYEWVNISWRLYLNDLQDPLQYPDWSIIMKSGASFVLFPQHMYNSIATCMSLFGFLVWLYYSPHMEEAAENLDRTRESFETSFVVVMRFYSFHFLSWKVCSYSSLQLFSNLLVTGTAIWSNCVFGFSALYSTLRYINLFAVLGLSVLGTNLLQHR
jgi:hypothetical protein